MRFRERHALVNESGAAKKFSLYVCVVGRSLCVYFCGRYNQAEREIGEYSDIRENMRQLVSLNGGVFIVKAPVAHFFAIIEQAAVFYIFEGTT